MAGSRRRGGREKSQKGKDGKRPRAFHRGQAQGRRDDKLLRETLEPAYARAEADVAETARAAASHRRELRDFEGLMVALARVPAECAFAALPSPLL